MLLAKVFAKYHPFRSYTARLLALNPVRSSLSSALSWQSIRHSNIMSSQADRLKRRKVDASSRDEPAVVEVASSTVTAGASSYKVPGLIINDYTMKVPLDHSGRTPGQITLFFRVLTAPEHHQRQDLPVLLYLQGGPGFESPRPTEASTWLKAAIASFRVVLMDQRGTGKSSAITTTNLAKVGSTPEDQAQYLTYFRADSIVQDAELLRKAIVPAAVNQGRWSILGQSFGGFCCVTYLSRAPEGLMEAMITGGIPPGVDQPCSADAVYRRLFERVIQQNRKYYGRFPGDVALVQRIITYLARQPGGGADLPSGSLLTPRAFQLLGLTGLGSGGGFERLHYLLESFFDDHDEMMPAFAKAFEAWMPWDTNPLYALVHEAIYCQGAASNWSAQRVREEHYSAEFDAVATANQGRPVYFSGEMVFPWMFDDFAALRPYKAAAELLARKADWPALYNLEQLRDNRVRVVAAVYIEDMYVDYNLAQETASHIALLRQFITNIYKHSAIRDDGERVFDRLLSMVRDIILLD